MSPPPPLLPPLSLLSPYATCIYLTFLVPVFSDSLSPTPHSLFFSTLSSCLFYLQLIIAVAGVLSGYNGSFEFKEPGQKYEDTPYVGMRVVGTMFPTQYHIAANLLGVAVNCEINNRQKYSAGVQGAKCTYVQV